MDSRQKRKPNKLSRLVGKLRGKSQASSPGGAGHAPNLQSDESYQSPGQPDAPPPYDDVVRTGIVAAEQPPGNHSQREQEQNAGTHDHHDVPSSQQGVTPITSADLPHTSNTQNSGTRNLSTEGSPTGATMPDSSHNKPQSKIWAKGEPNPAKATDTDKDTDEDSHPPPPSAVTHVGSDGSTSYYEPPTRQTTPGFEWASSSSGYDWDSRKVHYGSDNPTMGEAYQRQLKQRELTQEENLVKAKAMREEGIRIAANQRWVAHRA